ncbi:MAG: acyl carrier protein [Lachnospiraceae bacterium]|nr:acyl carrier protein [Lachnospiraceae bacterium]MCI5588739.1 acyl carrier protein [Lachnospiraceae bacterium]
MEFEKLQSIIAEILSVEPDYIKKDMTFAGDLGADSLELFQIVMGVEGEFDIIIQDEDAENIKTVGDLFQVISDVR